MAGRILKWALCGLCAVMLLLMTIIGGAGLLVGTPSGLKLLMEKSQGFIPGRLTVGEIEGGLLGRLVLKGISYRQKGLEIEVGGFSLAWNPRELLHGRLHVKEFRADTVHLVQSANTPGNPREEATGPFAFPRVLLPLTVAVDQVEIDRISVSENGGKPLEIDRVALDANVTLGLHDMNFKAKGLWRHLRWPLSGIRSYVSDLGRFAVAGTLEKYRFSLETGVNGTDIPTVRLTASGTGTARDVDLQDLHARLLDGEVHLKGIAGWKPSAWWKARAVASKLNPGLEYPDWPGSIGFELETTGNLAAQAPHIQVDILNLGGMLRKRRISGSGRILLAGDEITVDDLKLGCGGAELLAKGLAGKKWDLSWEVRVPDMLDLFPESHGRVRGSGRLYGTGPIPAGTGTISFRDLGLSGMQCRRLSADFSLSMDESRPLSLELLGEGISARGQEFSKVDMDLSGTLSRHRIKAELVHADGRLSVGLEQCRYDIKARKWNGILRALALDTEEYGRWRLERPVTVHVSREDVRVSRLCLKDSETSMCMQAHWLKKGSGKASGSLHNLSLDRFLTFFHSDVTEITGEINGNFSAVLGSVPSGSLDLSISPGHVTYRVDSSRQVRVSCRGGRIRADLDERKLSAGMDLSIGENGLNAFLTIPRAALEKDFRTAPLKGRARLDARELGIVTAFFPSVTEKEGVLQADFKLGGLLGDPQAEGTAHLDITGLDVPVAGIHIDETRIDVRGNSRGKVAINGELRAGKDVLKVAGQVLLDARRGWPVHLEIKGDHFRIMDIPDAMVRVSPDLRIDYSKTSGINVAGLVVIPSAEITPQELPKGVKKPSDDVVIVSDENPGGRKPGMPVKADVTIRLMDGVHVRGFGLDCQVVGQLSVLVLPGKRPVGHGELRIKGGVFHFYGHDLQIQKGIISYAGGRLDNPGINLLAVREVGGQPVGVQVTGYASALKISGYSTDPSVSSEDALTMLITGKTKNDPGFEKAARNTAAIAGADLAAQELLAFTGLDHLDVKGSGENSSDTRIFAGEDVTERLTLGVEAGTGDDGTQLVARYHLWKGLEFEIKSGSERSEMGLFYTIEIR